jgi:multiple sugar transport system permease protein
LGWIDTFMPLWVPSWLGGGAFAVFLMRQFFMSLPKELDEAAEIDGANEFRTLLTILVPLVKPAIATVGVISFISNWSAFLQPLIYLNTPAKFTFPIGLLTFRKSPNFGGVDRQDLMLAAAVIMAAPSIALFFLAQRTFVQGVVMSGIKG